MRARVAVVAVVAVYLILAPHPKNKEQKLKLEKMVFKDWSESKKQKEQNIGFLVWFAVHMYVCTYTCTHVPVHTGRQQTQRGGTIVHSFNFYILYILCCIQTSSQFLFIKTSITYMCVYIFSTCSVAVRIHTCTCMTAQY